MSLNLVCHTEESLAKLPEGELVAQLSAELVKSNDNPYDAKQAMWFTFTKIGYEIPSEIFECLEKDDSLEMWTEDYRFVFAMGKILSTTGYTVHDLSSRHWSELFVRDESESIKIMNSVDLALSTMRPQFEITDFHEVQEVYSPNKLRHNLKVKLLAPYKNRLSGTRGVFALVKQKPLS